MRFFPKTTLGIANKYMYCSIIYSTLRKPIVLKNHKVETSDNDILGENRYRNLLKTEIIPITVFSGVSGIYLAPYYFYEDLKSAEINVCGLHETDYVGKNKYLHYDLSDLLFV